MYWPISFSNTSSCGTYLSHPLLSSFRHLSSLLSYSHLHFFLTDSFRPPPLWASKHPSKIPQIPQNIVAMYSDVQRGGHDGTWSSDLPWVSPVHAHSKQPSVCEVGSQTWRSQSTCQVSHRLSRIVSICLNMSQVYSSVFLKRRQHFFAAWKWCPSHSHTERKWVGEKIAWSHRSWSLIM